MKKVIFFLLLFPVMGLVRGQIIGEVLMDTVSEVDNLVESYIGQGRLYPISKGKKVVILRRFTENRGERIDPRLLDFLPDTLSIGSYLSANELFIKNAFIQDLIGGIYSAAPDFPKAFQFDSTNVLEFGNDPKVKKPVSKKRLTIDVPVRIDSSVVNFFLQEKDLDSILFKRRFSLINTSLLGFRFNSIVFDTLEIEIKSNIKYFTFDKLRRQSRLRRNLPDIDIRRCTFKGPIVFSTPDDKYFDVKEFYNPLIRTSFRKVDKTSPNLLLSDVTINGIFKVSSPDINEVKFSKTVFNAPLFLDTTHVGKIPFVNCVFNSLVDMRGMTRINQGILHSNDFRQGANVLIGNDDNIAGLGLDNIDLQKVFFIVDWGWDFSEFHYILWNPVTEKFEDRFFQKSFSEFKVINLLEQYHQQDFEHVKLKFMQIHEYVQKSVNSSDFLDSDRQKVLNWIRYQERQYEMLYYERNDPWKYWWMQFVQATVNFGYEGEIPFMRICLYIISTFTLLYIFFFRKEVRAFLKSEPVKEPSDRLKPEYRKVDTFSSIDVIEAICVSFLIFFNPKYPIKLLNYKKTFIWLVTFECAIGLGFVILFLFFIAGNYPIITKLIGL